MNIDSHAFPQMQHGGASSGRRPEKKSGTALTTSIALPPHAAPPFAAGAEAAQAELRELKERYLRLAANFDNFRKRTAQEAEVRAAARKEAFILELLPVLDSLDRALASNGIVTREQLHLEVKMVSSQLLHLLSRHDIRPDDCLGQPFDPQRHEAIGTRRDATQPAHVVLEVARRGWMRGPDVLRPAKVIVNELIHTQPNNLSDSTPPGHDQTTTAQENKYLQPPDTVPGNAV